MPKVNVDKETAQAFFEALSESVWSDELAKMIEDEPKLLECTCPSDIDEELEWKGLTATECYCKENTPDERDMLCVLVEKGFKVTDGCYNFTLDEVTNISYLPVLLLSGYLPTGEESTSADARSLFRGRFFLDAMVGCCDGEPKEDLEETMKLILKKCKPGDQFSFGEIAAESVKRLQNLPKLEVGITHAQNGAFAAFLEEYEGNGEDDDNNDDEEEKPKSKRQKT